MTPREGFTPDELDQLAEQVATRLAVKGTLANLLTTETPANLEIIADAVARYVFDPMRADIKRFGKQEFTTRYLVSGDEITKNGSNVVVGLTGGKGQFDIVNFEAGFTAEIDSATNARQINIRGGGGGLLCFNYMVAACWADEVAAGRGVEGQTVVLFTGCTTKLYSTVKGAVDDITTSDPGGQPSIGICPGVYEESTITWPQAAVTASSFSMFGLGGYPIEDSLPGVQIESQSGAIFTLGTNPISAYFSGIDFDTVTVSGKTFDQGASGQTQVTFYCCRFEDDLDVSFIESHFIRCTIESGASLVPDGANTQNGVFFINCTIQGVMDFSNAAGATEVMINGCRMQTAAQILLGGTTEFVIANNTWAVSGSTAVDLILHTASQNSGQIIIANNTFADGPTSDGAIIRIQPGSVFGTTGITITGNSFAKNSSTVSSNTAFIKLIGDANSTIRNVNISGNTFGSVHSDTEYMEDNSGVSVIGDFVKNSSFGPNSPAGKALYNITNGTMNRFDGVLWSSGAPSHTDNYGAIYMDTATDIMYVQQGSPTGSTWAIVGVSGGGAAAATHNHEVHATVDGATASTSTPYQMVRVPNAGTIVSVHVKTNENVTIGATAWIGDIHKIPAADINTDGQGTTIYTTQGNRPTITNGNMGNTATAPDVTSVADGDYLCFYTDQAGSNALTISMAVEISTP